MQTVQINLANQNYQNRYDNNQVRNRFDNRRRPNKYQHYRNQPKAQITFTYTDQNLLEMMKMVRGFIIFMKANPTTRDQFKPNKLAMPKEYNNEVNKSEIHSSCLDQVQQLINEDKYLVFDVLEVANYNNEIECTDSNNHQQVSLAKKYNPDDYFTAVAEKLDIYNIDELGPTTGTVFQIFANNNLDLKISTLFDTGAMKSVMSWKMYQQLKLND